MNTESAKVGRAVRSLIVRCLSRPKRRTFGASIRAAGLLCCLPVLLIAVSAAAPPPGPAKSPTDGTEPGVSLAQSARALLAKRCLSCHGEGRISGLDLRTRAGALKGGARGPAVLPGRPEESNLYRFITGKGTVRMPPSGPLPEAEQELLRRWITAGAPWPAAETVRQPIWSPFSPLQLPPVPKVKRSAWVRNPIDAFILAKLEENGLAPAPPAGRGELIRRLSFDLTGLPPPPDEVEQFVADRSPDAYERLVDRLLAAPRYGERWARHWLDVVRFSESHGFERDQIRDHAWRYRDYVIQAFNQDLPYDRFVREQIAGDVIPRPTRDSIIATGFLVAGPWDEVGNTQASAVMRARVREEELEDMVSATAQTFLGLTVNCARCHNHKFDPIPQQDYYRIQSCLAGVRHGDHAILTKAEALEHEAVLRSTSARIAELEASLADLETLGRQRVVPRKIAERPAAAAAPRPLARWSFEGDTKDSIGHLDLVLRGGATIVNGRLRLNGTDASAATMRLPATLGSRTVEAWVYLTTLDQRGGGVITAENAAGNRFDGIVYAQLEPRKWLAGSNDLIRSRDPAGPKEAAQPAELIHLAITYAADNRITLYRNGHPYGESYVPPPGEETTLRTYSPGDRVLLGLRRSEGARPGDDRWFRGEIEEARLYDRALTPAEVEASFRGGPPLVTAAEIQASLSPEEAAARTRLGRELDRARKKLARVRDEPLAYAANPQAAPQVHLLHRGDVGQPGEVVAPGGLSCLPGLSANLGLAPDGPDEQRRLKLAGWITDPANPLTPRVMANRIWQYHFDRGIIATPSDFGVNGERPANPELLDWLAATFRESDWSIKRLHRLIVTSNTYRQSAQFNASAAAVDTENRLLWRLSPRRLEAEEVRDAMLAVSGQLNLKSGGPGFRPFSVFINNSHFYTYEDKIGPEYNRRSIYRTVVNSGGIPLLESFDCPDPSVKTPRRSSTTTPLQALELLNGSFVLRQAKAFARPELVKFDGKPMTGKGPVDTFFAEPGNLMKSVWEFQRHGQSGLWVSDLLPHLAECVDDLTLFRSMVSTSNNHTPATFMMNSGFTFNGFPSMGSWVSYGLGSDNQDLPAFVVLPDPRQLPAGGAINWTAGFLPAVHQGVTLRTKGDPIPDLFPAEKLPADTEQASRELLGQMNREFAAQMPGDSALAARIRSYELAARMQLSVPEVTRLEDETPATRALYGLDDPVAGGFGRNCLLARRLVERGVRFVQLFHGGAFGSPRINWDAHEDLRANHGQEAASMDRPVAGLLKDLKQRGLLDQTLVIWCTEFGRTPFTQGVNKPGRDHHQLVFTCWMAGAGLQHGIAYGESDEVGYAPGCDPVTIHDFHATILHLLGLDHEKLTFYHNGIRRRLTDVHGEVIRAVLG